MPDASRGSRGEAEKSISGGWASDTAVAPFASDGIAAWLDVLDGARPAECACPPTSSIIMSTSWEAECGASVGRLPSPAISGESEMRALPAALVGASRFVEVGAGAIGSGMWTRLVVRVERDEEGSELAAAAAAAANARASCTADAAKLAAVIASAASEPRTEWALSSSDRVDGMSDGSVMGRNSLYSNCGRTAPGSLFNAAHIDVVRPFFLT